jgi:hypothetical protein
LKPIPQKRAVGMVQDVGPEFKSQNCKKKERKHNMLQERILFSHKKNKILSLVKIWMNLNNSY